MGIPSLPPFTPCFNKTCHTDFFFFLPVSRFFTLANEGEKFLFPPAPNCLPSLSCEGPSLDWSLVKFLCHFLLLPSLRALSAPLALPQTRGALPSAGFGEDVTAQGTPHPPARHASFLLPLSPRAQLLPGEPRIRTLEQLSSLRAARCASRAAADLRR